MRVECNMETNEGKVASMVESQDMEHIVESRLSVPGEIVIGKRMGIIVEDNIDVKESVVDGIFELEKELTISTVPEVEYEEEEQYDLLTTTKSTDDTITKQSTLKNDNFGWLDLKITNNGLSSDIERPVYSKEEISN